MTSFIFWRLCFGRAVLARARSFDGMFLAISIGQHRQGDIVDISSADSQTVDSNKLYKQFNCTKNTYHRLQFHRFLTLVLFPDHHQGRHTWSPQWRILQCVYRSCLLWLEVSLGQLYCQCNTVSFLSLLTYLLKSLETHPNKTSSAFLDPMCFLYHLTNKIKISLSLDCKWLNVITR